MRFLPGLFLALGLLCVSPVLLAQQDYYWVGGSGNWSDVSHWATTSGGTTTHSVAPTSADNVYFDSQSFTGSGQSITIDVEANCHDFSWTDIANFPALHANAYIYISGSVSLNTDTDYNFDRVYFTSGDTGETVTTEGSSFGLDAWLFFEGTGEYALAGNVNAKYIYLNKGTFATNGFDLTADNNIYLSNQAGDVLDVSLGTSTLTASQFVNSGSADLTLNSGTSTIAVNTFTGDAEGTGPYTYYHVSFDGSGTIKDSNIFNSIQATAGTDVSVESGTTQTASSLDIDGTKYALSALHGSTDGTEATISISSGTVTVDYLELQDIHASGGATFNATNSIDNGNTTGWSVTAPTGGDYYWIGDSGNWTDPAHWATTSGGATAHGDYPGRYDDVYFDANSFTLADQTVTIDVKNTTCHHMDWTGVTNTPTIYSAYQYDMTIYGSAYFKDGVIGDLYGLKMSGEETGLEFFYGTADIGYLAFSGTGEYTLLDDIDVAGLTIYGGTINFDTITIISTYRINLQGNDPVTLNLQDATIITRDLLQYDSPVTINPGNSTMEISGDFKSGGNTFNTVSLTGTGMVTGSNTFDTLELSPGAVITFDDGETQTITGLLLNGEKSSPISLLSSTGGAQTTLSVASGTVDAIYLILQDIAATGGATFNADQTVDNGNNAGWNITGITSQDYYWVGGSGNWSDYENHWATSSGGTTFHTGVPGVLDNVFFDANSFSSPTDEVVIDYEAISIHDLDLSGVDEAGLISGTGLLNIYGSIIFSDIIQFGPSEFHFLSTDSVTITANNDYLSGASFYLEGTGVWMLSDSLIIQNLYITDGTLNFNGQYAYVHQDTQISGSSAINLTMGDATYFTRSYNAANALNYTLDASAATITFSSQFLPGTYDPDNTILIDDVIIDQVNETDKGLLEGTLSLDSLTVAAGAKFTVSSGQTISANQFVFVGTSDEPIIIAASTEGEAGTISQATGTVEGAFLEIMDNIATGGATFNAEGSLSLGNVSGWTFFKTEQSIDFPALEDKVYTDAPFELSATATSGLEVAFEILSGPATVDGTTLTLDGTIGTVQVKASQAGDVQYFPATSVINEFEVTGYTQEITYEVPGDLTYGDAATGITASSSHDLPLEYSSSDETVGTVSAGVFTITGTGETTVTLSQPGNDTVSAASPVEFIVTVNKASLTLTADDQETTYGSALPNLTFSSSGYAYDETETVLSTQPTLITSATSGSDAGSYLIEISGAEAVNYDITFINGSLTINQASQTITFDPPAEVDITEGSLVLGASSSAGLTVSFSLTSGPATLEGNTLTLTGTGELIVEASQAGSTNYLAASESRSILVVDASKTDQTITFSEITDKTYGDIFDVTASSSSGLDVVLEVISGPAVLTGSSVEITGVGEVGIKASQNGNDTFNPASSITRIFMANQADLTVTADDQTKTYGAEIPELTMTFEGFIGDDSAADITSPEISSSATAESDVGEYPILLTGGVAENYALILVNGTLTVNKATAEITFSNLEQEVDGSGKSPDIVTVPEGLNLLVTFSGSETPPAIAGTYEVVATIAEINYEGSASASFILRNTVTSARSKVDVLIYPNPASDRLTVSGIQRGWIEIYTLGGQKVFDNSLVKDFDISAIPEGTYLILVKDHRKKIVHRSVMIKSH